MGAEALYLLYRFETSEEFCWKDVNGDPVYRNLLDNREWFDIKMLTEFNSKDINTSIKDASYRKAIEHAFKLLGVHSNHTAHIGRVVAPKSMEFHELPTELIRILG